MQGKYKIAIIGSTGLLGSNLIKQYKNKYDIKTFSRSPLKGTLNDYNNIISFLNLEKELVNKFINWKPNIIINAVALIDLNMCENNYKSAYKINTKLAKELSLVSKKFNSYYIHISSDHFFMDKKLKHTENDKTILLNNYAKTKFEAEKEIQKSYQNALIVRTNIIGFRRNDKPSFFEWLINSLVQENKMNLYTNFYTSPIAIKQLSEIFIQCYDKKLRGIYNIASREIISKYNFGLKTAEKFKISTLNISKAKLINKPNKVHRALTLGLDVQKIENDLGIKMPTIEETLEILYKEYREES